MLHSRIQAEGATPTWYRADLGKRERREGRITITLKSSLGSGRRVTFTHVSLVNQVPRANLGKYVLPAGTSGRERLGWEGAEKTWTIIQSITMVVSFCQGHSIKMKTSTRS